MKKIITLLCAVATLTACDMNRLPYGSMSAEQITQDPTSSLESLVNGCYAQLKSWSDPMHRLGNMRVIIWRKINHQRMLF